MGKSKSVGPPEGSVRLSINLRKDLHLRLKVEATKQGRTMGDLIEGWIEKNCPKV